MIRAYRVAVKGSYFIRAESFVEAQQKAFATTLAQMPNMAISVIDKTKGKMKYANLNYTDN